MMSGNPHELAHKWMKGLGTDCGSAKHGTIRRHHSWGLLPPTFLNKNNRQKERSK